MTTANVNGSNLTGKNNLKTAAPVVAVTPSESPAISTNVNDATLSTSTDNVDTPGTHSAAPVIQATLLSTVNNNNIISQPPVKPAAELSAGGRPKANGSARPSYTSMPLILPPISPIKENARKKIQNYTANKSSKSLVFLR